MAFNSIVTHALILVLIFSVVPIALASIAGGIVAILQAATQVQEQSLTFLVKFCVMAAIVYLGFGFFSAQILEFFRQSLASIEFIRA